MPFPEFVSESSPGRILDCDYKIFPLFAIDEISASESSPGRILDCDVVFFLRRY